MKIDKNSWHMRLHRTFETPVYSAISSGWQIVTLCSYFWQTVLLVVWLAATVVSLAAVVGSVLYALVLGPLTGYVLGSTLAVMGFVWIGIITIFYGVWVFYRLSRLMSSKSTSKDGILVAYLKAKKAKFCPVVEVE
ncbi:membrane protein [Pseudomonas phage vB_PaeM_MAG1]|uniref:Uncharacterized protein n=1 Tax=Pseudomonas phage vB_PaeM_MAG1 TaxID=1639815 RepID=A0A172EK58_9CAUD|nr:membrane protein [Pseudomonas phage vB_PaeM_MAG1]ALA12129.1 hypothetical protein vB_PaeM_MAG1_163 [Pseudomonas phage vB_PaeM_MAG1]